MLIRVGLLVTPKLSCSIYLFPSIFSDSCLLLSITFCLASSPLDEPMKQQNLVFFVLVFFVLVLSSFSASARLLPKQGTAIIFVSLGFVVLPPLFVSYFLSLELYTGEKEVEASDIDHARSSSEFNYETEVRTTSFSFSHPTQERKGFLTRTGWFGLACVFLIRCNFIQLMGSEECDKEDEECSRRRMIAEAHLDYIYTQHKPSYKQEP